QPTAAPSRRAPSSLLLCCPALFELEVLRKLYSDEPGRCDGIELRDRNRRRELRLFVDYHVAIEQIRDQQLQLPVVLVVAQGEIGQAVGGHLTIGQLKLGFQGTIWPVEALIARVNFGKSRAIRDWVGIAQAGKSAPDRVVRQSVAVEGERRRGR